ncbi:hypothetical protein ACHAWF_001460 [Thalassiosira exigua]
MVATNRILFIPLMQGNRAMQGNRVWFSDTGGVHVIDQIYDSHNIFIANGTEVSLENGSVTAPDSGDDGEDAIRVEDATFHAISGEIRGGLGIGGTGVTISTTRNSDFPPGNATFEAGIEVYGGDATRDDTTKGGDAVQVLQSGSEAIINGGTFVPGAGCTIKVCGVDTPNGVALHVIQGKAIVRGGSFQGNFYNMGGTIELHGCLEYDEEADKIQGALLDGSVLDVDWAQPKGQSSRPTIVFDKSSCPQEAALKESGAGEGTTYLGTLTLAVLAVILLII